MKSIFLLAIISFLILSSCSIEKRIYNKGYSIQLRNNFIRTNSRPNPLTSEEEIKNDDLALSNNQGSSDLLHKSNPIVKNQSDDLCFSKPNEKNETYILQERTLKVNPSNHLRKMRANINDQKVKTKKDKLPILPIWKAVITSESILFVSLVFAIIGTPIAWFIIGIVSVLGVIFTKISKRRYEIDSGKYRKPNFILAYIIFSAGILMFAVGMWMSLTAW